MRGNLNFEERGSERQGGCCEIVVREGMKRCQVLLSAASEKFRRGARVGQCASTPSCGAEHAGKTGSLVEVRLV